jgi:transcription elongation factor Elf1
MSDCNHDEVTVMMDYKQEIQSITCSECGYSFTVPEFKKRKFKAVLVKEVGK